MKIYPWPGLSSCCDGKLVSQLHLEESGVQYQSFDYCVQECSKQESNHCNIVLALTVANRSLTIAPHPSGKSDTADVHV
jgi:hypothetical protein